MSESISVARRITCLLKSLRKQSSYQSCVCHHLLPLVNEVKYASLNRISPYAFLDSMRQHPYDHMGLHTVWHASSKPFTRQTAPRLKPHDLVGLHPAIILHQLSHGHLLPSVVMASTLIGPNWSRFEATGPKRRPELSVQSTSI